MRGYDGRGIFRSPHTALRTLHRRGGRHAHCSVLGGAVCPPQHPATVTTDRSPFDDETARLLVRRIRAGLWILLLAIALFAASATIFDPAHVGPVFLVLKAIQLGTVLAMFWLLRSPARWRWSVPAALITVTEVCLTTGASGIVTGDVTTTCLLFILFTSATAAFLPWGVRPQLAMVGVATSAVIWNASGVGQPVANLSSLGVAMVLTFVTSVYIAWDSQRYHLERRRAEEVLAGAKERSESDAALFEALARVGREMISLLDTPVILDRLCRLTTDVLGCEWSVTWLARPAEGVWDPVAAHGAADPGATRVASAAIGTLLAHLDREDVVQVAARAGLPVPEGALVTLHGALRHGDELIGIHSAACRSRDGFDPRQERMMGGITQLASLALANARLIEQLEHASRLKSEFVSTMSHELRTPLNVILGYADMLEDAEFDATEREDLLGRIKASGRELLELIESTLEIGRMEAGRDDVRFEAVSAPVLWSKLGDGCRRLPRKADVALEWSDGVPDVALVTDPRKLTVVVRNLVGNALKFTERGRVRVDAALVDGAFVLSVSDTGIGIRAEDRAIIFQMFRQADGSDARRYGGTGLGLYIVRRFVDQMGGTVAVDSEPTRGSTFTVVLPQPPAADSRAA